MFLAWINKLDAAVLSASGLAATNPVQNLQVNPLSKAARIAGTSMTIDFDYGSGTLWRVFGLLPAGQGGDATSAATIRVMLSDAAAGNTDVYDSGTLAAGVKPGLPELWHVLPSALSARYGRIVASDASKTFLDFGRLLGFGGTGFWEPSRRHANGYQVAPLDNTVRSRALGGALHRRGGRVIRRLGFTLNHVPKAEFYDNGLRADLESGLTGSVLVMLDPVNFRQEETVWGPVEDLNPFINALPLKHARSYVVEMES